MWMTSCTGSVRGGFGEIWEKSVGWVTGLEEDGWLSGPHVMGVGADGKVSIERLCLSPYVEKPLISKVIKSFVPELRSRKSFLCFRIPMFYVICVRYEHYMYVSQIHVWVCYTFLYFLKLFQKVPNFHVTVSPTYHASSPGWPFCVCRNLAPDCGGNR